MCISIRKARIFALTWYFNNFTLIKDNLILKKFTITFKKHINYINRFTVFINHNYVQYNIMYYIKYYIILYQNTIIWKTQKKKIVVDDKDEIVKEFDNEWLTRCMKMNTKLESILHKVDNHNNAYFPLLVKSLLKDMNIFLL